eukprot:s3581_g13.t1
MAVSAEDDEFPATTSQTECMVPIEGDQNLSSSREPESADKAEPEVRGVSLENIPLQEKDSSSSSKGPMPADPVLFDDRSADGGRVKTFLDMMLRVVPSRHFSLTLDQVKRKFIVTTHLKDFDFPPPYNNRTWNKNFGHTPTWQSALEECHNHMWKKWNIVKEQSPCILDAPQVPGRVPADVMADVGEIIRKGNLSRGLIGCGFVIALQRLVCGFGSNAYLCAMLVHSCGFGAQCSSFVPLCLSVSKRSHANSFFGDLTREFVKIGNALMMVTSFLMVLGLALGHHVTLEQPLEQPTGSVMPLNPVIKSVLTFFHMKNHVTYLGSFGAKSVKPVRLLSTLSLESCETEKPSHMGESLATLGPNGEYTGKKESLMESEHYPVSFGRAVAKSFAEQR